MTDLLRIIPDPDTLPVSSHWFRFLLYLTYYLHLIGVGVMLGLAFSITVGYFNSKVSPQWKLMTERLSKILPFAIAFAINLGVAPLLFSQVLYGNFFYPATIFMGIFWILLILLLIIGYYAAYWIKFRTGKRLKQGKILSVIVFSILLWTGFIMINVNTLMLTPERWKSYYNHMSGFFLNAGEPTLFPRFIFYIFLLLSIGGVFITLFYKIRSKLREAKGGVRFGSSMALYSLLTALPLYLIYLFILPENIRVPFTSGDTLWTSVNLLFIAGLGLTAYLSYRESGYGTAVTHLINLILFVFIRNHIRILYLENYTKKFPVLSSNTQYGVMLLFFIFLLAGAITIFWMLRKSYKEFNKQPKS